jgi:hypothetical protein
MSTSVDDFSFPRSLFKLQFSPKTFSGGAAMGRCAPIAADQTTARANAGSRECGTGLSSIPSADWRNLSLRQQLCRFR